MHIYAGYGGGPCPSRVTVPAPLHNAWPAVAVRADEVIITPNTLKSEWFQQLPCLRQVLSNQLPLLVVNWHQGFSHRRCVVKPMLKNTLPHQWYWSVMWSYKPCIALPMVKRSNVGHFIRCSIYVQTVTIQQHFLWVSRTNFRIPSVFLQSMRNDLRRGSSCDLLIFDQSPKPTHLTNPFFYST